MRTKTLRWNRNERRAPKKRQTSRAACLTAVFVLLVCLMIGAIAQARADKDSLLTAGFTAEVAAPLSDVLQVLQQVLHDGIIHGTLVYDREPTLTGATAVDSSPLFEPWKGLGQVFYKIRTNSIAPRHFRDSADQGTIGVRYIVQSVGPDRTRLHIDAVFVESAHHGMHPSDGSVESSEYKEFKDRMDSMLAERQEAAEKERREASLAAAKLSFVRQREDETTRLASTAASIKDLEERINAQRHLVERRVKAPGAELKSAPFHSSASLTTLGAYTEVVIVIVTPYWYGVETPEGQRGWIPQEQLESLP